ncbi:MAG: hypothetical protein WCO19_03110 [Candidatus Saccharibacteria bacterium]
MSNFESLGGVPFDESQQQAEMGYLYDMLEDEFVAHHDATCESFENLFDQTGDMSSFHETYTTDALPTSVFVRPSRNHNKALWVTANIVSTSLDSTTEHRVIDDYIFRLDTGFTSCRTTSIDYDVAKSFYLPDEVGPFLWVGPDNTLNSRSGRYYVHHTPIGLFGGWADQKLKRGYLGKGKLQPEEIMVSRLNHIERLKRLGELLGYLGTISHEPDVHIPEK